MNTAPALPTTPASLLPLVLQAMSHTPDARLRQLMASLATHLHQFVLENAVTEAEFERAVGFLIDIGQATGETKNEVILAADLLGVSTLVALLNNPAGKAESHSHAALLGPFWRANAPVCATGDCIARGATEGLPLEVNGSVFGADGAPLAGAVVDVWQASPVGLYENQDGAQPDMNLRGRFTTDAQGRYRFSSVRPAGYPVPTDGPCGELLRAQQRHPFRPAHLHFMVSHPGHKVLITQVFADDSEHLASDPVFGVTAPLVGRFALTERDGRPLATLQHDFHLALGEMVFPHPPIP
jgi:catechol 1,2-dioxygenase